MDRRAARVRVIVVNYNGGQITLRCLDALARTDWPAEALEIAVVDNASTDGVADEVRRTRPAVAVIVSEQNEGFGRACNRAMQDLTGIDHVALVNNDAVPEPGWLAPLVSALEADPRLGAVCPKVLLEVEASGVVLTQASDRPATLTVTEVVVDGDRMTDEVVADERFLGASAVGSGWSTSVREAGLWWPFHGQRARLTIVAEPPSEVRLATRSDSVTVSADRTPQTVELTLPRSPEAVINSVGGVLYEGWFGGDRGYLELDRGQYDASADVFSWSGAAVLLRTDYLQDVGLFNPALFLYYEDFELSWRGHLRGWRYRTVPTSVVRHRHGLTTEIGSERFRAWEDRSRWMTLTELAPGRVAMRAAAAGLRRAVRRGDGRGAVSGLISALRDRRRRQGTVDVSGWFVVRPSR